MNKSRLKKKYQDWPSRQNFKTGKKIRKMNAINFVEKLKGTILRILQKAI